MIAVGKRLTTLLAIFATGISTYIIFYFYFKRADIVSGPDAGDILAPLFFDISRSIHRYGSLAGMYNPGQVAGLSLWNTPYFHPLYPFYFNWLGSDASILDTVARLRFIVLLHLSIYASGSYLLCRAIGIRQWLSFVVGVSSPWLPAVHSLLNWPQILASFAWIPWVIATQLIIYRKPSQFANVTSILTLAAAFSLLIYAQPAQNMILAIVGSAIMWLTMAARSLNTTNPSAKAHFRRATLSIVIAGAITAVFCGSYLLEVVIYISRSVRWLGSYGTIVGMQRMPLSALREYALHWSDIVSLVVYSRDNSQVPGNLFLGAPLVIAAALAYMAKRDRTTTPLAASVIASLVFCFSFFAPVLHWLPIANDIRELSWWACYVALAGMPLCAYGLQKILTPSGSQGNITFGIDRKPAIAVLACSFGAMAVLFCISPETTAQDVIATYVCLGLLLGNLLLPFSEMRVRRAGAQATATLIVVLVVTIPVPTYNKYLSKEPLLIDAKHVERREVASKIASLVPDGGNFRFAVSPKFSDYREFTATLSNFDLRCIRGNLSPQEYNKFRLLFFPSRAISDLYGVKYQAVRSEEQVPGDLHVKGDVFLHVNDRALPRLFFVQNGVQVVDSPVDSLLAETGPVIHFFIAKRDVPRQFDLAPYEANDPIITVPDLTKNSPVYVQGVLYARGPGLLVLNEDPAGRWQATMNRRSVEPIRVNGFQTAFPVPAAGQYQVEIRRPWHLFGSM